METVGIRDLKARLSEYVSKARQGARIVITDHGKDVAELIPISAERQAIKRLESARRVNWAGGKPTGVKGIKVRGKTVSETLIEDRR